MGNKEPTKICVAPNMWLLCSVGSSTQLVSGWHRFDPKILLNSCFRLKLNFCSIALLYFTCTKIHLLLISNRFSILIKNVSLVFEKKINKKTVPRCIHYTGKLANNNNNNKMQRNPHSITLFLTIVLFLKLH